MRDEPPQWPGETLGLPESGPGAAVGGGRRFLALIVDLFAASLVTSLFLRPDYGDIARMQDFNLWSLVVWAVLTSLPVMLFNFSPGMAVCGIRVARIDGAGMVGPWRALVRCLLTFLIIPAVARNADGRGWHDRLTSTAVVRLR